MTIIKEKRNVVESNLYRIEGNCAEKYNNSETYGTNYPFMKTHSAIIECGVVVRIFFRLFY